VESRWFFKACSKEKNLTPCSILSSGRFAFHGFCWQPWLARPFLWEVLFFRLSGGSAIGAIIGILIGLSRFPGVSLMAFAGSIAILLLILFMSSGQTILKKDVLLLSGVMVNAFCAAVIMFLVSMTQDSRLHNIIFWLMGDLSMVDIGHVGILAAILCPCFILIFWFSNSMNLLLMGKEMAQTMGVNIKTVTVILLVATSFMVSATVSYCGLVGFVGLVVPFRPGPPGACSRMRSWRRRLPCFLRCPGKGSSATGRDACRGYYRNDRRTPFYLFIKKNPAIV